MLKLGKKFTASVLKYPSVISRSYCGSGVINEKHVAYLEKNGSLYFALNVCRVVVLTYIRQL
jgi:hypothetical protein